MRHDTAALKSVPAWWQAAPFTAVFVLFFLIPLALILMVSFWDFNEYQMLPDFTFKNYVSVFEGCFSSGDMCVTFKTYLSTFKFCLLVWAITLVLGFAMSMQCEYLLPKVQRPFVN